MSGAQWKRCNEQMCESRRHILKDPCRRIAIRLDEVLCRRATLEDPMPRSILGVITLLAFAWPSQAMAVPVPVTYVFEVSGQAPLACTIDRLDGRVAVFDLRSVCPSIPRGTVVGTSFRTITERRAGILNELQLRISGQHFAGETVSVSISESLLWGHPPGVTREIHGITGVVTGADTLRRLQGASASVAYFFRTDPFLLTLNKLDDPVFVTDFRTRTRVQDLQRGRRDRPRETVEMEQMVTLTATLPAEAARVEFIRLDFANTLENLGVVPEPASIGPFSIGIAFLGLVWGVDRRRRGRHL
jgi:hypothetical protein